MRPIPRVAAVAACLAAVLALGFAARRPPAPDRPRLRPTGAMQALSHWARQRAYPADALPERGFADAFAQVQAASRDRGAAKAGVKGWRPLGPHNIGGRTLALAFNPLNPRTLWAGTASGGLWRTTTGGRGPRGWELVRTGHPVLGVAAVAVHPADSNVVLIGTGEVYQDGRANGGITVRLARGSYGIGILRTTDGGATWTKTLDWSASQSRAVQALRIAPSAPAVVWAATTEGTYRSTDGGVTWQLRHAVRMATDVAVSPVDPDRVVVACGNFASPGHGLYRTADGGATWTKCAQAGVIPTTYAGKAQLSRGASAPDLVLASIGNGGAGSNATWLVRSDDGGATWTLASSLDYSQWQGWFAHDVAVHPQDPSLVLAAGIDVWKSTTGGADPVRKSDWTAWYLGQTLPGEPEGPPNYAHADHHDIVWHPTDPDVVYIAGDGGVFRSGDRGETFEGCNGGFQTAQFYAGFACSPLDSAHAMGGMQDNATALYDGSDAWIRVIGGDGGWAVINPADGDDLLGTAQYLDVYRSRNRGQDWVSMSPNGSPATGFIAPVAVGGAAPPHVVYAGGSVIHRFAYDVGAWSATNYGSQLDGNPALAIAVSPLNANVAFVTTAPVIWPAGVWRTTNGGESWTNVTGALPNRYLTGLAIDPSDDRTVYVTASGFGTPHLYRSTNRGTTWQSLGAGLPDVPTSCVAVDPYHRAHIYVGNDLGVFRSLDGGASWEDWSLHLPDAVVAMDLKVSPSNRVLRLVTHGNGVYERGLQPIPVGVPAVDPSAALRLGPAFPNPFNAATAIAWETFVPGDAELTVHDARGRLVRRLFAGRAERGPRAARWDGRDETGRPVASGVYLCRLRAHGGTRTAQLTLAK